MEKQVASFLLGATVAAALILVLVQRPPGSMVFAKPDARANVIPNIVIEPAPAPGLLPGRVKESYLLPPDESAEKPSAFGRTQEKQEHSAPAAIPVPPTSSESPTVSAVREPAPHIVIAAVAAPQDVSRSVDAYQRAPSAAEPPAPINDRIPRIVTVRAGTLLYVRLAETVSNELARPGDHFAATLDAPLVIDGLVIAERGARAEGEVTESERSPNIPGSGRLAITLTHLDSADGQTMHLRTQNFRNGANWNRDQSIAEVGAAVGIGAAIGAAAGGGKGAAIGAIAGGAAGTGGVLLSRNRANRIPAESLVTFRVEAPVVLTEKL